MKESDVHRLLTTNRFGRHLLVLESVDSTNSFAKSIAGQDIQEGTTVLAEHQSGGRGRHGRAWFAESGKNLTFSIILKPRLSPQELGLLSIYAAVAIADAVDDLYGLHLECKWPNDLLLNHKKVCGILSEGVFRGEQLQCVIMGIGMNVNQITFPPDLERTATSLANALERGLDRSLLLVKILGKLEDWYDVLHREGAGPIVAEWRTRSKMIGKELMIDQSGQHLRGIAQSVGTDGSLVMLIDGRERKVYAGEVTILGGHLS